MVGLIPYNKRTHGLFGYDDFRNMLDNFFTDGWSSGRSSIQDTFKIDVEESDNEYFIHAELPGIQKEEVGLNINDGKLTISVKREENINEEKKHYIHRERRLASMDRSVYLVDAKADSINAKLENGVLAVTVPKLKKPDDTIKIEIE